MKRKNAQQTSIEKVINLCIADQADELLTYIPIEVSPDASGTLLHLCSYLGRNQCVSFLLRHGASPNVLDKKHVFFYIFRTPLLLASWQGHTQVVITLLNGEADPNIPEENSILPIHRAAIRGYSDIIAHLIKAGSDPDAIDFEGYTPLHYAAKSGHYNSAEVLYLLGANPLKTNDFIFTPLDFAQRYGFNDIVTLLNKPRSKVSASNGNKNIDDIRNIVRKRNRNRRLFEK